jgi:hypothetical protein
MTNGVRKLGVRARVLACGIAGMAAWGCSGKEAARPADAGVDTVATADALPGDGEEPPDAAPTRPAPDGAIVDDMTSDQPNIGWGWFVYSDREVPNSVPVMLLPGPPPGTLQPPEGTFGGNNFPPGDQNGPTIDGVTMNARELSGGGEITYGAGFGLGMAFLETDGGPLPINQCEAGAVWTSDTIPAPVDASPATGLSFYGRSASGDASVDVSFDDERTDLFGGVCDPCATGGVNECYDHYRTNVVFTSTWQRFDVHWRDLATVNYSQQNLPPGGFDPTTFYQVSFQLDAVGSFGTPDFDIFVAYLQYLTD